MNEIRIATRRSRLALAQARRVAELLRTRHPGLAVRLVQLDTAGDQDRTSDITELTEVGAFVRSVQQAVIDGEADLAVHSLKDLPIAGPEELDIVAYPERLSPRDVLVGTTIDRLRPGAPVGTGSPRRSAQLLAIRPDLDIRPMRGNVDTRLYKVASGEVAAAVLAEAGLDRLDRSDAIAEVFDVDTIVPAPGQGALAVEARAATEAAALAGAIDDSDLRVLLATERLLLESTGAGCRSALGALAGRHGGRIRLDTFVADGDGGRRTTVIGAIPELVVAECRRELGL